jgi:hypothetical protein
MNMFILWDRVEIQLFYKVVHIIQEHVLVYYYNHSYTMPNHHRNLRYFKDTPDQILLTNHAFTITLIPRVSHRERERDAGGHSSPAVRSLAKRWSPPCLASQHGPSGALDAARGAREGARHRQWQSGGAGHRQ